MSQQQLNIPYGEVRRISQTEGSQILASCCPAIISMASIFLTKWYAQ